MLTDRQVPGWVDDAAACHGRCSTFADAAAASGGDRGVPRASLVNVASRPHVRQLKAAAALQVQFEWARARQHCGRRHRLMHISKRAALLHSFLTCKFSVYYVLHVSNLHLHGVRLKIVCNSPRSRIPRPQLFESRRRRCTLDPVRGLITQCVCFGPWCPLLYVTPSALSVSLGLKVRQCALELSSADVLYQAKFGTIRVDDHEQLRASMRS